MLVAFWEVQRLTREIHALEKEALDVRTELSHYEKYAGVLGGSSILNVGNLAGLNSSVLPRASLFAQYSDQVSTMSAMQNLQMMQAMGRIPMLNNPTAQYQINMSAFRQFKEEALKSLKQQEINMMNEKEKEIQLRLSAIETRLKEKRAMLDSSKQLLSKQVEESAPSFGLR